MEKFKNIDPQIRVEHLENTAADKFQKEEQNDHKRKLMEDPKFYIKRNMKSLKHINKEFKSIVERQLLEDKIKKEKDELSRGILPKYLVKMKEQAEREREETLKQIEKNKQLNTKSYQGMK